MHHFSVYLLFGLILVERGHVEEGRAVATMLFEYLSWLSCLPFVFPRRSECCGFGGAAFS
jgi:hypothetical protein